MTEKNGSARNRILVVEDDKGLLELILKVLAKTGCEAISATDGAGALEQIAAGAPNALLLDQKLPDMTGRQLLETLAERRVKPPFIIMTGQGDERLAVEMMKLGAADYLVKDMEFLDILPMAVERLFRSIELERKLGTEQRRIETIASSARDAIVMMAPDGAISFWNPSAERIFGYSREEALGKRLHELLAPEHHLALYEEAFPLFQATGRGAAVGRNIELEGRRADGSDISIELSLSSMQLDDGWYAVGIIRDITDRKRAEEALRTSEIKLRSLFAAMRDVIVVLDAQGRYVEIAPTAASLLYQPPNQLLGMTLAEVLPAELSERFMESIHEVLDQGSSRSLDYLIEIAGQPTWFSASISPYTADSVLWVARDITARKGAEEALRESEQRYRELVTNANSAILRINTRGGITFFNEFAQRLFGYAEDEVLGQNVVGTIVPETDSSGRDLRGMILDIVRRPRLYAQNENENMRRDGSRVWISWTNTPIFNAAGEMLEILCIGNDITARKQAEEQVKENEAAVQKKLNAIVDPKGDLGTLELADIVDRDLFRIMMESFHRITGIASAIIDIHGEVLVGVGWQDICTQFHRRHPETLRNCIESDTVLTQDVAPGTLRTYRCKNNLIDMSTPIVFEGRHLGNFFIGQYLYDDESHDASLFLRQARQYGFDENEYLAAYKRVPRLKKETAEAIMSFYFELTRIIANLSFSNIQFARNLTQRKRAEEEREKLRDQLNQAQKMESVGRLAGGVAHDFNNMLGVILGHTEMALEQVGMDNPLHPDLEEIQKAAQRSADLTRQLLAFARKQTVAPKVLDLNETVAGMLKLLRRLMGEDIDLLWKPGHEVWPVKVDPAQLDQILANLCVNARDAITGVGKVTIETDNASFDEDYCTRHAGFAPGGYVLLAVSDDGCGMNAETVSHIFEPFFTTKEIGKGTGLGLAMIYGVVRQNNGFINVYSEPGQGTTFRIYLPCHAVEAAPGKDKSKLIAPARGNETILLVEDEPANLSMTKALLERLGYAVLAADTPREAIRLAGEHADCIDLVITDVVMPEMNGRDLANKLLSIHTGIRRLFMSGYTANVIAHHGVLDEGVHFIQKPFSVKDLASKIREVLKKE